jgi:hypothetical protein
MSTRSIYIQDNTGLIEVTSTDTTISSICTDYISDSLREVRWREGYGLGFVSNGLWHQIPNTQYSISWNIRGREIVEWIHKQRKQQDIWRQQAQDSPAVADALKTFTDSLEQLVVIASLSAGIPEK